MELLMRQDDRLFNGQVGSWFWVSARDSLCDLRPLIIEYFQGARLCITAFDSGPLDPSEEELSVGWRKFGYDMVSPVLKTGIEIPASEYDEWYVFESLPDLLNLPEPFVNYMAFSLVNPRSFAAPQESGWDPCGSDGIVPIQDRFWLTMDELEPAAYIALGDFSSVVSRNRGFVDAVAKLFQNEKNANSR